MRTLGLLLLTVGFLGGAFVTSLHADNRVDWGWFLPALALAGGGVALARLGAHRAARSEDRLGGGLQDLQHGLENLDREARRLADEFATIDVYDLHLRIDERFPQHLDRFVEARETLIHVHGLQAYADVMNPFAAGERYLNRVWSCSVDGYIDEARTYVDLCSEQFAAALEQLQTLPVATDTPR